MDKIRHIWRHGFWGGAWHTTVEFGYLLPGGGLVYICSCGESRGEIPSMRDE